MSLRFFIRLELVHMIRFSSKTNSLMLGPNFYRTKSWRTRLFHSDFLSTIKNRAVCSMHNTDGACVDSPLGRPADHFWTTDAPRQTACVRSGWSRPAAGCAGTSDHQQHNKEEVSMMSYVRRLIHALSFSAICVILYAWICIYKCIPVLFQIRKTEKNVKYVTNIFMHRGFMNFGLIILASIV